MSSTRWIKGRGRARLAAASLAAGLLIASAAVADEHETDVPFTPVETVYVQDFEDDNGGYVAGGTTSFEHGAPVSPPTTVPGQGPNMWGTNLDGDYANLECGYLQSVPIDLTGSGVGIPENEAQLARLAYRQWLHTENKYDAGIVLLSADGVNFTRATPVDGYDAVPNTTARTCLGLGATDTAYTTAVAPAADAWTVEQFDVTRYLGGMLHVRWAFATDSSVVKRGWYVDDVAVQLGVGGSVAPPAPPEPSGVPFLPLLPLYAEDFEASGSWTPAGTNGAWEWGEPVGPPEPLPGSLKLWGTRLLGNYLPGDCATVTSPAIKLPPLPDTSGLGVELARLSFKLWRSTENRYDGAVLQVSKDDGATWGVLTPDGGRYDGTILDSAVRGCLGVSSAQAVWTGPATAPGATDYLSVEANLTPFFGSTIKLRMAFGADAGLEAQGVYFDDVAVELGVGLAAGIPDPGSACENAPGWTSGGNNSTWCYGLPTTGPASTKPVFATNLGGNYNPSECSSIVSPAIDTRAVAGVSTLTLQFDQYMKTASTLDGGVVQVSANDGATWTTMTPVGGYNSTLGTDARECIAPGSTSLLGWSGAASGADYQLRQVRLAAYDGQIIRVRFIFGSSASLESLGWYLRSIGLTKGAGAVPLLP